jgi:hypothetical protein
MQLVFFLAEFPWNKADCWASCPMAINGLSADYEAAVGYRLVFNQFPRIMAQRNEEPH